ncbi:MAG: cytochrome ubiquinol oxidase subunit I [Bacteroidales bacterium]|nr:cytochrome ubiquinol oxidase subunit I [Bacteroidales bacterium]
MIENADPSLVDWSRAQFALTAIYHWIFVPLTLGLSFILAIMETIYVKTGNEEWKSHVKFWMTLFGINFAIGVATGIILEFEFGTNWSNYSWFVGDIFGAPLAIEGILAFFLESTFIAVMFFGWNKVSRKVHLLSTWLVAFGSNLSALWILVANGWMQNPVGMVFNPETARNEMVSFWAVLFNQAAVDKFLHTISSSYVLAAVFVLSISSWFLIRRRHELMAQRSILVAGVFGILASVMTAYTGDESARTVSRVQPLKFAAMEALTEGKSDAGLIAFGLLRESDEKIGDRVMPEFIFRIEIPGLLSVLTGGDRDVYVPGIKDHVNGNMSKGIMSVPEKAERGRFAKGVLTDYKRARMTGDTTQLNAIKKIFADKEFQEDYFRYFGYSAIDKPEEAIPNIAVSFYSFHIMVMLGFFFMLLFGLALFYLFRGTLQGKRWFLWILLLSLPLPYISSQLGWILAEMGRQPWIIQDLMHVDQGVSQITSGSVLTTFILFALLFTVLLISEISIMIRQIKAGPKH